MIMQKFLFIKIEILCPFWHIFVEASQVVDRYIYAEVLSQHSQRSLVLHACMIQLNNLIIEVLKGRHTYEPESQKGVLNFQNTSWLVFIIAIYN